MDAGRTISAVAAATGFSPSALRFYEDAGLVRPGRTEAGYRVYDDRAVERLRFISRAKQLGLSLEEVGELVGLWDGEHCAPVAGRLGDLVADKLRETHERIAELSAFAADLERARAGFAAAGDEPCGDRCACQEPATPLGGVGVSLMAKPPPAAAVLACSLERDAIPQRIDEWRRLLARAVGHERVGDTIVASFLPGDELAAEVAGLAAVENTCCSFFTFTIHIDHTGTTLTIGTPADAAELADALFGAAT